jgi:hypothetical protein
MTYVVRVLLPALAALATSTSALADPPVGTTIPEPNSQPVAATIAPPTTKVSTADVAGTAPIGNYGAVADTKMICKTETPTGSRLGGHTVCMTKAERDKQSRAAQRLMNSKLGAPLRAH